MSPDFPDNCRKTGKTNISALFGCEQVIGTTLENAASDVSTTGNFQTTSREAIRAYGGCCIHLARSSVPPVFRPRPHRASQHAPAARAGQPPLDAADRVKARSPAQLVERLAAHVPTPTTLTLQVAVASFCQFGDPRLARQNKMLFHLFMFCSESVLVSTCSRRKPCVPWNL